MPKPWRYTAFISEAQLLKRSLGKKSSTCGQGNTAFASCLIFRPIWQRLPAGNDLVVEDFKLLHYLL
jgi:hypothetical protein